MTIGEKIALLRKNYRTSACETCGHKEKMTQLALAKKIGFTRSYIAMIESNMEKIPQNRLEQISFYLNIDPNNLLKEEREYISRCTKCSMQFFAFEPMDKESIPLCDICFERMLNTNH